MLAALTVDAFAALGAVAAVLHPRTRCWLRARARQRALEERRRHREAALDGAHASLDELAELTACVDRLDQLAPGESERLELEALLDRYVELEVARSIAGDRLSRTERWGGAPYGRRTTPVGHHLDAQERQTRTLVRHRMTGLDDQIEDIADLIRLSAARAALPDVDYLLAEELPRRLELLGADEAPGV